MRTAVVLVAVVVGCMVPAIGRAEEDAGADAGPCASTPTHDAALELRAIAEKLMKLASGPNNESETLASFRESTSNVRKIATKTRCAYSQFSASERAAAEAFVARAEKWADASDVRLDAEDAARTGVIVPLCQATWILDGAKADIAREKSNPSGVHDLRVLHSAGQAAQYAQDQIDALKPRYVAHRKHPFTGWRTEGACVVASRP